MDFVIVGLQPWDIQIGSNCKDIAKELSKSHRVLYVNDPLSRNRAILNRTDPKVQTRREFLQFSTRSIQQESNNLWVYNPDTLVESANFLRPHKVFRWVNYLNNQRFAKSIMKATKALGFQNYLLFNDNSIYLGFHLKELLKPSKYIYYIRDNLTKMDFWKYHGERMEPKLIEKADLVVTNSLYYAEMAGASNPNSHMIGQGCDFSLLTTKVEISFPNLKGPVIGYVGFLTSARLSIKLIHELANKKQDWSFVLIGPEDDDFKRSSLHSLENVHFLGAKDVTEISAYIDHFDVCFNPQELNEVTIGNYPRKIDEYLFCGKPTVATYTKAMEYFGEHVSLAKTEDEYIMMIKKEIETNSLEKKALRRKFAESHSWESSVKLLEEQINAMIS
ncbi:MAG: glycosyltransferase [Bacteroidota bacterium]